MIKVVHSLLYSPLICNYESRYTWPGIRINDFALYDGNERVFCSIFSFC